ncbi:MAG: cytochrome c biogenesis CcdA family protein, partial [Eubacteriales bacterium]
MPSIIDVDVNVITIFWAGIASFFTPCVLPLMPVYFSVLAGTQINSKLFDNKARKNLIINTISFILGISFVYIMLGIAATSIGKIILDYKDVIRKIGGIVVILIGLNYIGIIKLGFINKEKKFKQKNDKTSFFQSFVLGLTFSFGWSPCISSFLVPVITMAMGKNVGGAIGYFSIYTLGFSIPFLIFAILTSLGVNNIQGIYKYLDKIKIIGGLLLIIMG